MPGTISQREQAVEELKSKNRKDIFALPPELQVIGNSVKIYSVGPWSYQRSMGSYGQWLIQAAKKGFKWILGDGDDHSEGEWVEVPVSSGEIAYSKPTEVPYITNDPVHLDMFQMAHRHDSGRKVAQDIIGVGQFHTPGENLEIWGVFIASGDLPAEKELKAALKKLHRTFDELINEADNYWNQGPSEYKNVTEMHRLAAAERGQMDKPWARGVVEMKNCPVCGNQINPGAALCTHCDTVFDEKRVIAAKVPGYEYLWAPKKKIQTLE